MAFENFRKNFKKGLVNAFAVAAGLSAVQVAGVPSLHAFEEVAKAGHEPIKTEWKIFGMPEGCSYKDTIRMTFEAKAENDTVKKGHYCQQIGKNPSIVVYK